jgi:CelD/BcsL family acetyltransferase involved in cellulose biosynthesis
MFVESRADKAEFLTAPMSAYFRDLALTMAAEGLLRCGVLEVDARPLAAVIAFDYNGGVYLYNSGFDRDQSQLSVGIISKVLLIKDSIERGKRKFDFLKGGERYKYHLGGKEVRLLKCRIERA